MHDIKLIAKRNFEIVDFFGESHPVVQGETKKGKYLGKKGDEKIYSIVLYGNTTALYGGDYVNEYFETERVIH